MRQAIFKIISVCVLMFLPAGIVCANDATDLRREVRELKADNTVLHEKLDALRAELKRHPKTIAADGPFVDIGGGKVQVPVPLQTGSARK